MLRHSFFLFSSKKAGAGSSSGPRLTPTGNPRIYTLDASGGQSHGTVMLVGWLYSAPKALNKYAEVYNRHGLDVVVCTPNHTHVMSPDRARQLMRDVEGEVAARQNRNPRNTVMLHSFSMGAYMTSLWMMESRARDAASAAAAAADQSAAASPTLSVIQMVKGQALDSPVDYYDVPRGLARATFMTNPPAAKLLEKLIRFSLSLFPKIRAEHIKSSEYIINNPIHAPSIWFYGDEDVISTPELIDRVTKIWEAKLLKVEEVDVHKGGHLADESSSLLSSSASSFSGSGINKILFNKTKHVTHMRDEPKLYTEALEKFLVKYILPQTAEEGKSQEKK